MRPLTRILILLVTLLAIANPSPAALQASGPVEAQAASAGDRLVLFEAFLRST